jgi:hypothetical protein
MLGGYMRVSTVNAFFFWSGHDAAVSASVKHRQRAGKATSWGEGQAGCLPAGPRRETKD